MVKLVDPDELIKVREEKRAVQDAKASKKAMALEAERQKKAQRMEKGRVAPLDMFKPPNVPEGTYGGWNDDGLPLTDAEGKMLSKNLVKKTQKEWGAQKKLHDEYLDWKNTTV